MKNTGYKVSAVIVAEQKRKHKCACAICCARIQAKAGNKKAAEFLKQFSVPVPHASQT